MRLAGIISLSVDGVIQACAGDFTFNLGTPLREALVGPDNVHGYKETPQVPFIEGDLRYTPNFDIKAFYNKSGIDAQLKLATGETFVFIDGWVCGEGTIGTSEATMAFRFEAKSAEKV